MTPWLIVAALAVVAALLFAKRGASPTALARQAASTGDLGPLLLTAEGLPPARRPAFFHAAIQHLWRHWQRPLAARLTRDFASRCPDDRMVQYWLRQVLEVEPAVARQTFDEPFLAGSYRPEVAKGCCQTSS